jgi:hypothetical protein
MYAITEKRDRTRRGFLFCWFLAVWAFVGLALIVSSYFAYEEWRSHGIYRFYRLSNPTADERQQYADADWYRAVLNRLSEVASAYAFLSFALLAKRAYLTFSFAMCVVFFVWLAAGWQG